MPHLVSKNKFTNINTKINDFEIYDYLQNNTFSNVSLLPFQYGDELFFIEEIRRENNFLYKIDKLTKPHNLQKIKEALSIITSNVDVISHNLHQKNQKHTKYKNKYIKEMQDFIDMRVDFIEIGFGSGRHILNLAKNNKDKIIVGFEIHDQSIRQVLNAIDLYELQNLYICHADARIAINAFAQSSISKVFLHFPVPWNKAKHRRVISHNFIKDLFYVLNFKGIFNIRSDDIEYIKDAIDIVLNMEVANFSAMKNKNIDVVSKYEQRWKNYKKDIYELNIFKQNLEGNELHFQYFDHSFLDLKIYSLDSIKHKKWISENYFISTKDLFSGYKNGEIFQALSISFGSFHMPFSTYLILENKIVRYLKYPITTISYRQIHRRIYDILKDIGEV